MISDNTKFEQDTILKSNYTVSLTDVEFIVEQKDPIGLYSRLLWSTLYHEGEMLHPKYVTELWGGSRVQ